MTENDLKRLMAQQYLLYKKLIEVEDKLKGRLARIPTYS